MELSTPLLLREPPRSRALGVLVAFVAVALTHPRRLRAAERRPGGLTRSRLSACRAARLHLLGAAAGAAHGASQRPGLQLLSHPADRPIDDRSRRELGRPRPSSLQRRPSRARWPSWRGPGPRTRRPGGSEADLMAELARVLLGGTSLDAALPVAAERIASALQLPSASLQRGEVADRPGRLSVPLSRDGRRLGTLVLPAGIDPDNLARLRERLVPGLEALLAAAIDREVLLKGTVETEALRRSDEIKTALLRTVSHDLRTPITAIRAAAEALDLADHRGGGSRGPPRGDHRRLRSTRDPGRQPARPVPAAHRYRRALTGLGLDRGGRRGGHRRPRPRSGPLPALDRRPPAIHQGGRRPARARLRQPALERGEVLGRRAGLGSRSRGLGPPGDPGRRSRPGYPRSGPGANLRGLLPGARRPVPHRRRAWAGHRQRLRRGERGRRSRSNRCPGRARPSWSSSRSVRRRWTSPEPLSPAPAGR